MDLSMKSARYEATAVNKAGRVVALEFEALSFEDAEARAKAWRDENGFITISEACSDYTAHAIHFNSEWVDCSFRALNDAEADDIAGDWASKNGYELKHIEKHQRRK